MQFVFARRGRRVFQRLNLHQTATLSTRASPAVDYVRRVSRLSSTRTPTVIKAINSPATLFANANTWARSYATAAASRGRPKAHTGRATSKKSSTKTQNKTTKKKEAAAKPKVKRELTPEQLEKRKAAKQAAKEKEEINRLRAISLRDEEPKAAATAAWPIFLQQRLPGHTGEKSEVFRALSSEFKDLSSSELEALQRQAEQNRLGNQSAYQAWVNSHSPLQIKEANHARKRLATLTEDRKHSTKLPQIKDERQVKRPINSFLLFFRDRVDSGDLKHMSLKERAAHVKAEFDNLSQLEKQKWTTKAEQDKERYIKEYRDVYGQDPYFINRQARASS